MNDYDEYLIKFCDRYKCDKEEAEKMAVVKYVKAMYEEKNKRSEAK